MPWPHIVVICKVWSSEKALFPWTPREKGRMRFEIDLFGDGDDSSIRP